MLFCLERLGIIAIRSTVKVPRFHFQIPSRAMSLSRLSPGDPSSHSRPDQAVVTRIHLDLTANFTMQVLTGSVTLGVRRVEEQAKQLKLDCSKLNITQVKDDKSGELLDWNVGDPGQCGSELSVTLPSSGDMMDITLSYSTSPSSSALQWLSPSQSGGEHPYLFSQCQAIHCRAMVPCQDTPSVKVPYTAIITVPTPLTALMSALRDGDPVQLRGGLTQYKFSQPVPVQSYLIALAVGQLDMVRVGPRSLVWGEKKQLELAKIDFSETEEMLTTAESLCGPYVWGGYDILVLPPSFPFGGMENPCLTFATPTLLSGDKSNANVIAHEIAHSWTGNLVTNCNFEHFWLNEGFTVFTERKIIGRMRGEQARHFAAMLGWRDLEETVNSEYNPTHPFTALVPDLSGVDPDDAFSSIPYEKGHTFLWYLEELVGGAEKFEPFLKAYYEHFMHQSINTDQFKSFFLSHFANHPSLPSIDWDTWLYSPGMPPFKPDFDTSLAVKSRHLADRWIAGDLPKDKEEFENFSAEQQLEFLGILLESDKFEHGKLEAMDKMYSLSSSPNTEVMFKFVRLGIKARWENSVELGLSLATRQGRMKFVRPLFRDLWGWEEQKDKVEKCFRKHRGGMMAVCREMVGKDLGITD